MRLRVKSLALNLLIPAALTVVATRLSGGGALWWWLFYANLQMLVLLAKDKLAAERKWKRTPESTLLLLALAGGSPALLGGRFLFNHKISKKGFTAQMCGVIALQALALFWFFDPLKMFN